MAATSKRATVYFDPQLHRALRLRAAETGCSPSAIVNGAVRDYLAAEAEGEQDRARRRTFRNEDEEREFWATHSPLDFFDLTKARRARFPNLKPSLKSISIRLPEDMLNELKVLANKKDVPYQSLAKLYLAWGIQAERRRLKAE